MQSLAVSPAGALLHGGMPFPGSGVWLESAQGSIERRRERRITADQVAPPDLVAFSPTLEDQPQRRGGDGQDIRAALDQQFAFERLVQGYRHGILILRGGGDG